MRFQFFSGYVLVGMTTDPVVRSLAAWVPRGTNSTARQCRGSVLKKWRSCANMFHFHSFLFFNFQILTFTYWSISSMNFLFLFDREKKMEHCPNKLKKREFTQDWKNGSMKCAWFFALGLCRLKTYFYYLSHRSKNAILKKYENFWRLVMNETQRLARLERDTRLHSIVFDGSEELVILKKSMKRMLLWNGVISL